MSKEKEVWRRILESQDYEINAKGQIRLATTKKKVPLDSGLKGERVKLWFNGDARTFQIRHLIQRYFPETLEWRQSEKFPDYEVSHIGTVRNLNTQFELPIMQMRGYDAKVALWHDGTRSLCTVRELVDEIFPDKKTA
jgi:hypothetical protein